MNVLSGVLDKDHKTAKCAGFSPDLRRMSSRSE
jgi:hypothetical protein